MQSSATGEKTQAVVTPVTAEPTSQDPESSDVHEPVETETSFEYPPIFLTIESPAPSSVINPRNPLLVTGRGAGMFEGTVVVQVLDAAGKELAHQPTILKAPDLGLEGTWSIQLDLPERAAGPLEIIAYSDSPKDGSWVASDKAVVETGELSLEGTPWLLVAAGTPENDLFLTTHGVSMRFDPESNLANGRTSCNYWDVEYEAGKTHLRFGFFKITVQGCTDDITAIEKAVSDSIHKVTTYRIIGEQLHLLDANHNALLTFRVDPVIHADTFTRQDLENGRYFTDAVPGGTVTLEDGVHSVPEDIEFRLAPTLAFGDLDGDGVEEAVTVLTTEQNGELTYSLGITQLQAIRAVEVTNLEMSTGVRIRGVSVSERRIVVETRTGAPGCCPWTSETLEYAFSRGMLVPVAFE